MTKQEKNEVIDVLKGKFTQYSNFYVTDTESLTVAQVNKLRSHCFDKQVEMRVAKNTLIKKALESLDTEKYAGVYDSLHKVTALLFSENPKEPALILTGFRKESKGEKPALKAAFINGDVFVGDNQLKALTQIKTKNELIGEVIGLLMSPIQRVLGALQNKDAAKTEAAVDTVNEVAPVAEKAAPAPESSKSTPEANAPAATPKTVAEEPAKAINEPVAAAEKPVAEKITVSTEEPVKPVAAGTIPPSAEEPEVAPPVVAPKLETREVVPPVQVPAPAAEAVATPGSIVANEPVAEKPVPGAAPDNEVTNTTNQASEEKLGEAIAPTAVAVKEPVAEKPVPEEAPVAEPAKPAADEAVAPEAKKPVTE